MKILKYKIQFEDGLTKCGQFETSEPSLPQAIRVIKETQEKAVKSIFVSIMGNYEDSSKKNACS